MRFGRLPLTSSLADAGLPWSASYPSSRRRKGTPLMAMCQNHSSNNKEFWGHSRKQPSDARTNGETQRHKTSQSRHTLFHHPVINLCVILSTAIWPRFHEDVHLVELLWRKEKKYRPWLYNYEGPK